MIKCRLCGTKYASEFLQICVDCIRNENPQALEFILSAFIKSRTQFDLPIYPPKTTNGISCDLCFNECKMGSGDIGFCGIRKNINGKIVGPTQDKALLHEYYDRNPTNCCAAWFCPAQTGCGYPKFTQYENGEYRTLNHSIFFYGCNFNCLYCQNASHKTQQHLVSYTSIERVFHKAIRDDVTCVCYFGGSPEPHFPFALNLSEKLIENPGVKRICWEWNGGGNQKLVLKAANYSLISGGNVKFDLKAYNPLVSKALLGVSVERTYQNFINVANLFDQRPEVPLLTATTLLVPYYVDEVEIASITQFIADINPHIPYSMLVFHPQFFLSDLPITPISQVKTCYQTAKKNLKNVHVGNLHLLGNIHLD